MNGTSMIVAGIAIFILGAVCGARIVYRFRHVTTKALHQALLNTLHERTARLDRLTEPARETTMVAIDGNEKQPDFWSETEATSSEGKATALKVYRGT
jgi:hypothetical protein